MSKTIAAPLAAHLAQPATTLCRLWRVALKDGTVLGFTDHDQDVAYGGLVYRANSAFTGAAVRTKSGMNVDDSDVQGFIDTLMVSIDDIEAGRYDGASVTMVIVNWASPADGAVIQRVGELGEISHTESGFTAELRGLMQRLSNNIPEITSPGCRAELGDARCTVDLPALAVTASITSLQSARGAFTASGLGQVAGYFRFGRITMTSGANAGQVREVRSHTAGGVLVAALEFPRDLAIGDSFSITPGCDRRLATCIGKFGNVNNFRGEPFMPGRDRIFRIVSRD